MLLTKMVEVDDACVAALTPEVFQLALEARGWRRVRHSLTIMGCARGSIILDDPARALGGLADHHHHGSTYDAFTEVERVQALLEAVQAAERGEWVPCLVGDLYAPSQQTDAGGDPVFEVSAGGIILHYGQGIARLWPGGDEDDPTRAAREARAQLPRLVRIICGVEGSR